MAIDSSARPTVGRERELAAARGGARRARRGRARPASRVEGEPGIGKTRLLGELRERAEERGLPRPRRAPPRSSSATCRSASGPTRSTPTSPPRSSTCATTWDATLVDELPACCRRCAAPGPRQPGRAGRRALPRPPRGARPARAARGRAAARARARRPALERRRLDRADRRAPAPRPRGAGPARARLPPRAGARAAGRGARRARRPAARARAAQRGARPRELLGDVDAAPPPRSSAHGGGNPFYLEQLARAGRRRDGAAGPSGAGGDGGVPAAVAASLAEELGVARRAASGRCWTARPSPASRSSPTSRRRSPSSRRPRASTALDELLARDLVRPTAVPRRFAFRHPLVRRAVYESTRGGWRLARARARRGRARRRGAPAPPSAPTTSSSPRRRATRRRSRCSLAAGADGGRRARPPPRRAGSRRRCGCCPAADAERQVERARGAGLGAALDSASSSAAATTLLEAIELLPADAGRPARRADRAAAPRSSTGSAATRRRTAVWRARGRSCPTARAPAAAALQIELAVDGLYELDFDQTLDDGPRGARDRPRRSATAPLIAAAASALALGEAAAGEIAAAREHRARGARARSTRLSDAELAPRLEALYYLGWAENYLEHYDEAIAHVDRGIAIARATGEGRLLVPLMLVEGLSVRDRRAGSPRRSSCARRPSRRRGCPATRTTSSGRCSSWASRTTTRATSTARSPRARRARASAGGWPAARCPRRAAGRAGARAARASRPGERRARLGG